MTNRYSVASLQNKVDSMTANGGMIIVMPPFSPPQAEFRLEGDMLTMVDLVAAEGEQRFYAWDVSDLEDELSAEEVTARREALAALPSLADHIGRGYQKPEGTTWDDWKAAKAEYATYDLDTRLQHGEKVNFYTYEGPKSDLEAKDGGVSAWKKGVVFDHPDEGTDEDRYADMREAGPAYNGLEQEFEEEDEDESEAEQLEIVARYFVGEDGLNEAESLMLLKEAEAKFAAEQEATAEKSLHQMIDAGEDRPAHVSEDDWTAAQRAYNHQMTLENTPEWYINGGSPEDERFYEAMANGPKYESRDEIVAALRTLEAEGQKEPEIIQGWNTYTLKGDEVHKQNHESHPDRGGEWEVFDANDTERTIDSHWMQEARHDEQRDEFYAQMAQEQAAERVELVGQIKAGNTAEATRQGYSLDGDVLTLNYANGASATWHVDDLATEIEQPAAVSPVITEAQADAIFAEFADDHMATIHDLKPEPPQMTDAQVDRIFADAKETAENERMMELAEEIEHGFPSLDPMFDDLNSMMEIQRKIGITPSSGETAEREDKSADRGNVVDFKAMAADFKAAGKPEADKGRAVEAEQGV